MDTYCAFCEANVTTCPRREVKVRWLKDAFVARLPEHLRIRSWRSVHVCESCWKEAGRD